MRKDFSKTLFIVLIINFIGGFMDGYSYLIRGGLFVNAQTGNIIIFAKGLALKDYLLAYHSLIPLVFFSAGVLLSTYVEEKKRLGVYFWKETIIFFEMLVVVFVALMPDGFNLLANGFMAFAAALQVNAFRSAINMDYPTTLFLGNVRNTMELVAKYAIYKSRPHGLMALKYLAIIATFIFGAFVGFILSDIFHHFALLFLELILFSVWLTLLKKGRRIKKSL